MFRSIDGRLSAKTAARILTLSALLISAVLLAQISWNFLVPERLVKVQPKPLAQAQIPVKGFTHLASTGLFGERASEPVELPQTRLNWTLKGIYTDQHRAQQAAFLVAGDGSQKLYWAGAMLPGQVRLEAVLADRVILNRAGQREILRLKVPESGAPIVQAPIQRLASGAEPNHVPHFLERVQAQALYQQGSLYGLTLSQSEPQALATLGLNPSDVITHINGAPVGGIEGYRDLLSELAGATSLDLTLERQGAGLELTINMDDAK